MGRKELSIFGEQRNSEDWEIENGRNRSKKRKLKGRQKPERSPRAFEATIRILIFPLMK